MSTLPSIAQRMSACSLVILPASAAFAQLIPNPLAPTNSVTVTTSDDWYFNGLGVDYSLVQSQSPFLPAANVFSFGTGPTPGTGTITGGSIQWDAVNGLESVLLTPTTYLTQPAVPAVQAQSSLTIDFDVDYTVGAAGVPAGLFNLTWDGTATIFPNANSPPDPTPFAVFSASVSNFRNGVGFTSSAIALPFSGPGVYPFHLAQMLLRPAMVLGDDYRLTGHITLIGDPASIVLVPGPPALALMGILGLRRRSRSQGVSGGRG